MLHVDQCLFKKVSVYTLYICRAVLYHNKEISKDGTEQMILVEQCLFEKVSVYTLYSVHLYSSAVA